ncbi:MAG: DivIVA domain-containing protein [Vicinamibacterales bacterium]
MKVTPLDLRQSQFKTAMRGFDKLEVKMLLDDAADDYEAALREIDRLRQDVTRMESALAEHRDRESSLRNTLLTAQRLADQVKEQAEQEARVTLREAEAKAELLVQKAQSRLEEIGDEVTELKLKRREAESGLEATIASLTSALDAVRTQDRSERDDLSSRTRVTAPLGPRPVATAPPPPPILPPEPVTLAVAALGLGSSADLLATRRDHDSPTMIPDTPAAHASNDVVPPESEEEEMLAQLRQLAHRHEQRAALRDFSS